MRHPLLACTLAIGLTVSAPAFADNPAFTYGKKDDVKDVSDVAWTGKAEAGVVATTGNSRTTTASASANVTRKSTDNKFDAVVAGTFARASTLTATDANMNGVIDDG